MIRIPKTKNWSFVILFYSLMVNISGAIANPDAEQTTYLCLPDDRASMGISHSTVGKTNFSALWKFLVSEERGPNIAAPSKYKFKELDWDEWKTLTYSNTDGYGYSYVDMNTHFSFFPGGFLELTFKFDYSMQMPYDKKHPDLYSGISLVGSCSAIE